MSGNGSSDPAMTSPDRPLRIIHCFRAPVGGVFRHVRDLAEQHSAAGHQVGFLCDSSTGGAHEEKLFEQIRPFLALGLTRLPIRRSVSPGDAAALWRSYKQVKELQPDVLHGHGAKGGVLARTIGSALRVNRYCVARLYSPHGGSLHFSPASLKGQGVLRLERLQERFGDALVFVCDYEREVYERKVGKPTIRAERIYNGIGEREFEPVPLEPGASDFLYIGEMRNLKGPDVFIDAFARAERLAGHPLSATMVGNGKDRDRYQDMIVRHGLDRRIEMLAAMPARQAFARAPRVVVPSRAEALPYIVLEALAAGKTVIASDVGGIPEILGRGSEALAKPGDAADLARIMAAACADPGWHGRVMPSPQDFRSRHSASQMAQSMLALYRDLLHRPRVS